jgi:hypothetical protein
MNTFVRREEISGIEPTARPLSRNWWNWKLWLQWVMANVTGEVLGLGLVGAVATAMVLTIGEPEPARRVRQFARAPRAPNSGLQ